MSRTHIRWLMMSTSGLAAAGLLGFLFWPRPIEVDTDVVAQGSIADVVADQGIARVRQAYVVSAPVAGRLERLPLEVGDRVVANKTVVACIRPAAPSSSILDRVPRRKPPFKRLGQHSPPRRRNAIDLQRM
jgi:HlyD family secretion protein